ncbi:hypothetical protein BB560_002957 [Smittium megazygosporum]|uniref:PH domain-containing protein n=1 Tax=Smittium megazygosporum TaxID=133381 RepID=A0A2T9ZDH4_9FUNG|nr:hypothetical protein BB560_002957 [Smittium megazygosporum]
MSALLESSQSSRPNSLGPPLYSNPAQKNYFSQNQYALEQSTSPTFLCDSVENKLQKETQLKSGFLKYCKVSKNNKWKTAWCVLRVNALTFYKSEKEYKALKLIKSHEINSIASEGNSCFKISTNDVTIIFKPLSQTNRDKWIQNLEIAKKTSLFLENLPELANLKLPEPPEVPIIQNSISTKDDKQGADAPRVRTSLSSKDVKSSDNQNALSGSNVLLSPSDNSKFLGSPSSQEMSLDDSKLVSATNIGPSSTTQSDITNSKFHRPAPLPLNEDIVANLKINTNLTTSGTESDKKCMFPNVTKHVQFFHNTKDEDEDDEKFISYSPRLEKIQMQLANEIEIRSGYLYKKCRLNRWTHRWFVLRSSSLTYYKNNKEYKVSQLLSPKDIVDIQLHHQMNGKRFMNKKGYIQLITSKRSYWLIHDDYSTASDWVQAIKNWKGNARETVSKEPF